MTKGYNNKGLVRPFRTSPPVKRLKKTNSYLYGEGVEVPMIDEYTIARRVELLGDHLEELTDQSYHSRTYEDIIQINKIIEAMEFWTCINSSEY